MDGPQRVALFNEFVGHAAGVEEFQCPGVQTECPGDVGFGGASFDDGAGHAREGQFACGREPGGTGSHDGDVGHESSLFTTFISLH